MGTFAIKTVLANPADFTKKVELELLVDTGSVYTWVPASVLEQHGINPSPGTPMQFQTIEGRLLSRRVGVVHIMIESKAGPTPVVFAEPGDLHVLGAMSLEGLGFDVDVIHKRLVSRPIPAA